ncbi:CI [Symbiodinium microadriaticum]|nr:CI [Symbiodinium microadriaticum]
MGWKRVEFAEKSGVQRSYLSAVESGKKALSLNAALSISKSFKVSLDWLFGLVAQVDQLDAELGGGAREDYVLIPRLDIEVAAGAGAHADPNEGENGDAIGAYAFSRAWLRRRDLSPQHLSVLAVRGDSMEPKLADGDLVLVDDRQTAPTDGWTYVFDYDQHLYVKALQMAPDNKINLISANPDYPPIQVDLIKDADAITIKGKRGFMLTIDWDFIASLEGTECEAYVPDAGQSGVTIGTGFDLGAHDAGDLHRICSLNTALPGDMEDRLSRYLGLKGQAAKDCLAAAPLTLTMDEVTALDIAVKSDKAQLIARTLDQNKKDGCPNFEDLPAAAQTIVASVGFQYGQNIHRRCPTFFRLAGGQDWPGVIAELRDFGDSYPTRRRKEAAYLAERLNGPHMEEQT